ncbi:MAG: glycosyltransferase family 4 protein [Candidatus Curtissbacteria bacterium]|nr:glycosyltransferase family 4 protein [Candidatus Curtissbacteria bacterium]
MKILLISEFFPTGKDFKFSGGVEARTLYLAKYLAKKGHNITVLTSQLENAPGKEKLLGFTVLRVGKNRDYKATAGDLIKRANFAKEAIKMGKSIDCDIIDGSNFLTHFIARQIASRKKIPVVAWYPDVWIGSWIKNAGIVGILGEFLERFNLITGFSAYIAISKSTAAKLAKKVRTKITIIPCGIDEDEFGGKHQKSNISTIICVSRLAKYKNIKDLILAFALVSKEIGKIKLIIVGSGPQEKNLKSLTKNLKLESQVQFLSNLPRKELINLYFSSSIFCLPSSVEGFGISTVESAAAGTPYVISDIGVFKEVTKNGQGGLLFKLGDIKDLAANLERLLIDRNLYKKKQTEGQKLAAGYRWPDIALKTEKLYLELIRNHQSNSLR